MIACNLYGLAARICVLFFVLTGPAAFAQPQSIPTAEQRAAEARAAWTAGLTAAKKGPATVSLGSQGSFQVPAQLVFIPVAEATRILRAMGNSAPGADFLGLVTHPRSDETWIATISFRKEGYIKDDDAEVWNADELLDQLMTGTEHGNKDRRARGFREI